MSTASASVHRTARDLGRGGSRRKGRSRRPDERARTKERHPVTSSTESTPRRRNLLARRWAAVRAAAESGMSTAEYAVGTVAACAFAAVLYRVVTGGSVVTGPTRPLRRAPPAPSLPAVGSGGARAGPPRAGGQGPGRAGRRAPRA